MYMHQHVISIKHALVGVKKIVYGKNNVLEKHPHSESSTTPRTVDVRAFI
jgi:hypothetical protein